MMDCDSSSFGSQFGQRSPPLRDLIKNILNRYPDGGQILKELIQNADDAGATKVEFLYDCRSFSSQQLPHPGLSSFQGPALYAFNDAKFSEDDWKGIQNLMKSNKKDDPLKVGRFGIGFNSVYHITDLPGIVSGDCIGFLDPHEKYFGRGESGRQYDLKEGLLRSDFPDQFLPFNGIFGCNLDNSASYEGTLFRFPLRATPSYLSEKEYTKEMVQKLFQSLREEASVILLFLKNVQSISVHERQEDDEISCLFKVEVTEETRLEIKEKRQEFLRKATGPDVTECTYIMNIQETFDSEARNFRWLVANQVGSNDERIVELADQLKLLPWVGIAVPIDAQTGSASTAGRIFCFLPLPPDVDCQTGLPVHVHGYFGVMDNRRGLVWPGNDCQNNDTAEWNELLLQKVGIRVYSKILESLVKDEPKTGLTMEQRCQLVYSVLPDSNQVKGHWKCILKPLFQELIDQKLFYCQSRSGSSWITLREGILDQLSESDLMPGTRQAILRTLVDNGLVVITELPKHVNEAVDEHFGKKCIICPSLVRRVLKSPDTRLATREDRILLLGYVLSDDPTSDLSDVPLLPLKSGEFCKFRTHRHQSNPSSSVFIPSESCPETLLPNMENRFLDPSLPEKTAKKLHGLAVTNADVQHSTQLVSLTKEIVVENLLQCLPHVWSVVSTSGHHDKVRWTPNHNDHPPEQWPEVVWRWIRDSYPKSLTSFNGVPLIPLRETTGNYLGILSEHSKFIFASDSSEMSLPSPVIDLLAACGCTVVSDPPSYLYHQDIHSYIAPPTPRGTVTVLRRVSVRAVQEHINRMSINDRNALREFLCRLPEDPPEAEKSFLLQLPLFDTLSGSATGVQVDNRMLKAASPEFSLPAGFGLVKSDQIISSADHTSRQLLALLSVEILKPAEVFLQFLFPDIKAGSVYDPEKTSEIMVWIVQQMFNFKSQCERFPKQVMALPFVRTDHEQLRKPSELYDPSDDILRDLFLGEEAKFPTEDFRDPKLVSELKELGLQTRNMVTAVELLEVAMKIDSCPLSQSSIAKTRALIQILQDKPAYLQLPVDGNATLKQKLLQLKWLPCSKDRPVNSRFPKIMPWFNGGSSFFSPPEIRSESHVLVIGSVMPILHVEMNKKLQEEFGLTSDPPLQHVVNQLEKAVRSWERQPRRKGTSEFQEMLLAIYLQLSKKPKESVSVAISDVSLGKWIWQGDGFCSPAQTALQKDFSLDLRPQLFLLPDSLRDPPSLPEFFLRHGVRQSFSKNDILGVLVDIKKKHEGSTCSSKEVESDLKLCRSVLEWVVKDEQILTQNLQEKVLVPVQSAKDVLILKPCKKCTYCDQSWLRRGGSELDIPDDYELIHQTVRGDVAQLLGVPALSTCLLSGETLGFEQTGPHEPITTRLKNILNEYKEGAGVFKELIQNADDAGARTVRFLVDWRHGPKEKLLSPKMAQCQGPALWAYNDAVFTDKDFENINKLAGATKVEDLAKIGRFGLGFNAVYHLTDVPSFVSREYLVIFDPNVNHLDNHIKDQSRPGIRINLATNPRPLTAFEDQFQPYHDIFGCNTQCRDGKKFHCDGTLFRFPYRTRRQAKESEICESVYNKKRVEEIVASLKESASLLLLYTQHVNDVELYELANKSDPKDMQLVLSVRKSLSPECVTRLPFLKECYKWWKERSTSGFTPTSPSRTEHVTIEVREKGHTKQETWLLSSSVGTGSSVHLALGKCREHCLLPCAGVAAKLRNVPMDSTRWIPEAVNGEAFCFLPLSFATGFPVHVNGYFAVTSNRRGLWERGTSEESQPPESQWNEALMEDALSNAYLKQLEEVKRSFGRDDLPKDSYYNLWPCYGALRSRTWEALVESVYTKMIDESLELFWSYNGNWVNIHQGYVLGEDLSPAPGVSEILSHLGKDVLPLTTEIRSSLSKSGQDSTLEKRTLTLEIFFKNFLFPSIRDIPEDLRDPIICFGLDAILRDKETLVPLFRKSACVSCSEGRLKLAKPCDLISPKGAAASLYSAEDCRFPVGEYQTENRLHVLERLGMVKDQLPLTEVCERARSIENLVRVCYERGLDRVQKLVKYLNENIMKLEKEATADDNVKTFTNTKFIPFMSKAPPKYTLPWEGKQHPAKKFFPPVQLFLEEDVHLVGSCCLIVDESDQTGCGKISTKVKSLMGFSNRRPNNDKVLKQLEIAMAKRSQKSLTESVCKKVYKHLNAFVKQQKANGSDISGLVEKLRGKSWLYIQGRFISSDKVCFSWTGNGAPYLYRSPDEFRKYESLMRAAGVRENFQAEDFIQALDDLNNSKEGKPLNENEIKLTVSFLNELKDVKDKFVKTRIGNIPLPDENRVLHNSKELTINESFWLKDRGDALYVHKDVTPQLALDLGAQLLLNRRRNKYTNPLWRPFGQHEALTNRLKNILKSYPCDSGILKELVQNADDAKATEIHFIYDTRVLPHERVFLEHAEEIQGPALCVYNDKPFTDEDLEGIQRLGIGSKGDDPEKTGQYGIGFNAVYHLTDCPSFLSDGDTLCVFDPHCCYAPGATPECPGVMIEPIDDDFKEDFSHTLLGFTIKGFEWKGSTMFRLPLRNANQARDSKISDKEVNVRKMRELLTTFQSQAKKMLLFLHHVKKISLSEINKDGYIKKLYEVECKVDSRHEKERQQMASLMKECKDHPTSDVPWKAITYPVELSDSQRIEEKWLIHKCFGAKHQERDNPTPDGQRLGLFPRGGVAALVSFTCPPFTNTSAHQYLAYCFLPLPVPTCLPVHVNGHFALNPSRRALWVDADQEGPQTKWNNFIKSRVIAPGYAALITEAKNYIPDCKRSEDGGYYFQNREDAEKGLKWYHDLFPHPSEDSEWNIMASEVYRFLGEDNAPILPVVVSGEVDQVTQRDADESSTASSYSKTTMSKEQGTTDVKSRSNRSNAGNQSHSSPHRAHAKTNPAFPSPLHRSDNARASSISRKKDARSHTVTHKRGISNHERIRNWLPVNRPYFVDDSRLKETDAVLLRLDMPLLLYSSLKLKIYESFQKAGIDPHLLTPMSVIEFLRTSQSNNPECKIGCQLPSPLQDTRITSETDLSQLISYCRREERFPDLLEGLPLLLTADKQLRVFDSSSPVYRSKFSDLFPSKTDKFVHPKFVDLLADVSRNSSSEVMFDLTVPLLASFLPEVFPRELTGCSGHVDWSFPKDGVLSESWFKRLWKFLESKLDSLQPLGKWPIIPTTHGKLVTINNAKTVFDLTESDRENQLEKNVRQILENVDCPSMRKDIVEGDPSVAISTPSVLYNYVAHPYCAGDVVKVLDYMRRTDSLDPTKLDDEEILKLLRFFQVDRQDKIKSYVETLKALPFFKAIDGSYCAMTGFSSYVLVPTDIPVTEMEKLQRKIGKSCLLLHRGSFGVLSLLYQFLNVQFNLDRFDFYQGYILPHFSIFTRNCQIEHLTRIRDIAWLNTGFLEYLRSSRCIPDTCGDLHLASSFYDPRNEVYRVMLDPGSDKFPSAPFDKRDWLDFLFKIGLKKEVDEEQFRDFCRTVERISTSSQREETNKERSKVLVRYLLREKHLHGQFFLESVSRIRFVAPQKVEDELLSVHEQYQCQQVGKTSKYVHFQGSIPWIHRKLVWTSAQLLPEWVNVPEVVSRGLGVQKEPSIETVMAHLKTISCTLSKTLNEKRVLPQTQKLKQILNSIYKFLDDNKACGSKEPSCTCSSTCKQIGDWLKSVSCVFLEEENTFVKPEQLSFHLPPDRPLKPLFFVVPREYGIYDHLLKRLGATEKVSPFQMASVLKAIRDRFTCNKVQDNYAKKARDATYLFFKSIDSCHDDTASPMVSDLGELYLLSEAMRLVQSTQLVCEVPPRLIEAVAKQGYHVLLPLERCELPRAQEGKYLRSLPDRLRPGRLETVVREVLDPSCLKETCQYCRNGNCCPFIERYIVILKSTQFQQGVVRLIKHQKKSNELTDEEKEKAARLSSDKVEIKCMKAINTRLINAEHQAPLEGSSLERTCHVTKENDSWTLYIQHEFGGKSSKALLTKAVNEIMGSCVECSYFCELTDMLSCDTTSQISGVLSEHDVSRDFSEEEGQLGREIPAVYHYLIQQNPLCTLRKGDLVAYGVDSEDSDESEQLVSTKYTLCKIISYSGESTEADVAYNFEAEYWIDLGNDTKQASVLDLYKFDEDMMEEVEHHSERSTSGQSIDVQCEKRKLGEALRKAWTLELKIRRKVIRRLYLHWLRCEDDQVASEMIEFLKSEVGKLQDETDSAERLRRSRSIYCRRRPYYFPWCLDEWVEHAKIEKEIFHNFRRSFSGSMRSFSEASDYVNPQPEEAVRWIEQSTADLQAARFLHGNVPPFHALTCFMSQQVTEKCLKAALYAKCGLARDQLHTHDIHRLICDVKSLSNSPKEAVSQASSVANYYLPTRYPNRQPSNKVPAKEFSSDQAKAALDVAGKLLEAIRKFVMGEDS